MNLQRAARYTCMLIRIDELPKKLEACAELRLDYLVKNDDTFDPASGRCMLFAFFDRAGMQNYLNGFYDDDLEGEK